MSPAAVPPLSDDFIPLSQVTRRPVRWFWPGRLAWGKLALLQGDAGLGKSLLTLHLAACLTTGRPLPDGSPVAEPAGVIIFNGEDTEEDTTAARLEALGADPGRVFIPGRSGDDAAEPLSFPSNVAVLERALARTQARLVVLDPVTAFLDRGVNCNSEASVRRALRPLAKLAQRYGCVVLLVLHLNKRGGRRALYRGLGSVAFAAVCRSAWLVAADPVEPGRRVLAQVKNNNADAQPSLVYALTCAGDGPPQVSWLGVSDLTAEQLLEARRPKAAAALQRDAACEALAALLAEGAKTSRQVWAMAEKEGISERTLRRARRALDVRSKRVYIEGRPVSYWLLPGQQLPPDVKADGIPDELEQWLRPLCEKYPSPSPIDEW
jgi:hypothetical protein